MVLTWRSRLELSEKLFPHCEHKKVELIWILTLWWYNLSLELNTSPHSRQLNSPWLLYKCLFKLLTDNIDFLQTSQVRTEVDSFFFLVLHIFRWESSIAWEINPALQLRQENTSQLQFSTTLNLNRAWTILFLIQKSELFQETTCSQFTNYTIVWKRKMKNKHF